MCVYIYKVHLGVTVYKTKFYPNGWKKSHIVGAALISCYIIWGLKFIWESYSSESDFWGLLSIWLLLDYIWLEK